MDKRILLFICLICISTISIKAQICSKSQLPTNLQNGLVAFYPFCGNANDASGNGNNGIVNGALLTNDRFGVSNQAYYFSSTGCAPHIQVNMNTSSIKTGVSISFWVLKIGDGCIGPRILEFFANDGQGQSQWIWNNLNELVLLDNTSTSGLSFSFSPASNNVWTHLVYTNDGKTANIYQDGKLVVSKSSVGSISLSGNLAIGRMNHPLYDAFNGNIDDLIVYDRALNNCEVSQLYNSTNTSIPQLQSPVINSLSDTTRVCGSTKTLDAGAGFSSYLWNTGEKTQSITPNRSGKYTVTVSDASGCTATDSTYLSLVNAKIVQRDTSICVGSTMQLNIDSTLNAGSNKTVRWSNGSNFNSIRISPLTSTKYQVIVSDGISTCMDSVMITVVDTTGFNTLSDTTRVCGTSVTLSTITGFTNYAWNTGATTQSISPTNSGFYKITASKGGCSISDSTYLSIVQAKILQRDTTICLGSSINLSIDSTTTGATVCNSSQFPTTLQNGLVGYYPFCGNANDASGKGNNGIIYGATLDTDRFNNLNSAYNFNGNGQYIDVGTLGMPNTPGDLTYSAWIKINKLEVGTSPFTTTTPRFIVISKRHFDNGPSYITFTVNPDSAILIQSDGFLIGQGTRAGNVFDGSWKMVTGIKRGNQLKAFIDGRPMDSIQINNTILSSSNNFHIGHHGAWGNFSNGKIDDVAIWNRALTDNEVSQLYRSQNVSWSTGATSNSISVSPSQTTKYYVTVSNGTSSCVDSITVNVSDLGSFNSLQDTVRVCGDSATLDAGPGFTQYKWSNGATTQKIVIKSSGKYSVAVTNTSGCSASDSSFVSIVKAKILQRDTILCRNTTIKLSIDTAFPKTSISNFSQINISSGLRAYYPFNGNANDESGFGNNATVYNAILTSDQTGAPNKAYSFSPSRQSSIIANRLDTTMRNSFAYSFWVRPTATCTIPPEGQSANAASGLFNNPCVVHPIHGSNYGPATSNAGTGIYVGTNGLYLEEHSDGWEAVPINYTGNLTGWHLINLMYTNKVPSLYIDGKFIKSGVASVRNIYASLGPDKWPGYTKSGIGAGYQPGSTTTQYFSGDIDELRYYNRALSGQEIQNIYNGNAKILWSTGDTTPTINVSPTQTTKYYVTVSDGITSCRDSITVTVASVDTALTVLDNPAICSNGGTVRMQAKAGASAYQWKRNGVSLAGANSALFIATQTGNYHVVITGIAGCMDSSRTVVINISPVPIPDFTINMLNQCLSLNSYTFTNTSNISAGTMSYNWSLGNGAVSSSTSPIYAYPAAGSFIVKLVTTSDKNCKDSITKSVTIYPKADTTLTLLDAAVSCANIGTRIKLNDNMSYKWLRDGLQINGATTNQYAALQAGEYRAVVTSINGCADSTRSVIIGINPLPVTNFTINNSSQCLNENGFILTNTSTISSGTMLYKWDFGDGSTVNLLSPSKKYIKSGTYYVKLISTSDKLCIDSISKQVILLVDADSSITALDPPEVCSSGGSVRIQAGNATTYKWIKDGAIINGTNASLFSAFQTGNYQVIVSTAQGCFDTSRVVSIKLNPQPVPNFTINNNAQCLTENSFTFTNTSAINSGNMTYRWTFGDGSSSTITSPGKSFVVASAYTIKLITTSDKLCTDSISKQITIYPQPPIPVITGPNEFCKGLSINLQTTGNQVLNWYKNDALLAGETLNTLQITQGGDYKVVSTNINGCRSSSFVKAVMENLLPVGSFDTPATLNICEGSSLTLSASGASSYQWLYNNIAITGATAATYKATKAGLYSVDFFSNKGCLAKGINSHVLKLVQQPDAIFSFDTYCAGVQTNFSSKSVVLQSGLVRYYWQFGDGKVSSNGQNAFNTYASAGNYKAKLVVTPVECPQLADSAEKLITVESPPAGNKYPPVNAIINRAQQLSARNIGITYQWTPSSYLSSSLSRTPIITTSKEQLYLIYITNQASCNIVDTQLVRVFPDRNIYVPEGFTPDNDGYNDRLYPMLVGIDEMRVFKIFNRWGTLVFDNKNANVNTGWNGTYLGRTQPMDTYAWVAEGIDVDGKLVTRTGNTILIR